MCGIAGIWGGSGAYVSEMKAMLGAMAHRGPDGQGMTTFDGGAAGAVRLALVDLTDHGLQPLWSPDRRVAIVYNGEVYNYAEHRPRLAARGYPFQSTTDTEVVLALYLEHGLDFVRHLRGMFALALLDWRESSPGGVPTLILARDPLGIKPLYWARPAGDSGPLVFASEVRTLLASGLVRARIDSEALVDYLAIGFVVQPRTIFSGVRMLERGTLVRITPDRRWEQQTYWTIPPAEPAAGTFDEAADRLRSILEDSVALHAMADAPVGAFLSGGVDSTGVVGLMIRRNPQLRTYTIRLPDQPEADESAQAVAAAHSLGCEPTVVDVTGGDVRELLPRFAGQLDQPSNDGLNTWLISRGAARDVKGVLSGLGGDEWFAGYPVTRRLARYGSGAGRVHMLAGRAASVARHFVPANGPAARRCEELAVRATPLSTWTDDHRVFGYPLARKLVSGAPPPSNGDDAGRLLALLSSTWREESPVGFSCLLDVAAYMGCQLLRDSDAVSMAHSLELRVPLVDTRIAEFARSCPDDFKLHPSGGTGSEYEASGAKRVLIHALRDVLPPDIGRRPKRGFALPYDHWVRHHLGPLVEDTCSREAVAARGLLDPDLVDRLRSNWHGWPQVWSVMVLELWCRAVLR